MKLFEHFLEFGICCHITKLIPVRIRVVCSNYGNRMKAVTCRHEVKGLKFPNTCCGTSNCIHMIWKLSWINEVCCSSGYHVDYAQFASLSDLCRTNKFHSLRRDHSIYLEYGRNEAKDQPHPVFGIVDYWQLQWPLALLDICLSYQKMLRPCIQRACMMIMFSHYFSHSPTSRRNGQERAVDQAL